MKILVIGSGGREHALSHTFFRQGHEVFCIPGNAGTREICQDLPHEWSGIDPSDFNDLTDFVNDIGIELTVCGPESPLSNGIADFFQSKGLEFFGPSRIASYIECSKSWSKDFMFKHGIPTARYVKCTDIHQAKLVINEYFYDWNGVVVKPSGLTAGKGVEVCSSVQDAEEAVNTIMEEKKYGGAGQEVIIEERLKGQEVSIMALCDGETITPMICAQDHKRLYDNGQGPNTGGVGAYSPTPFLTTDMEKEIKESVIDRTCSALKQDGIKYIGFLYFGIMFTAKGPKVLEYNCRFGDPEAQTILPLLETDLAEKLHSCCRGELSKQEILWKNKATCTVVMISRGYPKKFATGYVIQGLDELKDKEEVIAFHAGTEFDGLGQLVTSGGRVVAITAIADTLEEAIKSCYDSVSKVHFQGAYYRSDIASEANKKIAELSAATVNG